MITLSNISKIYQGKGVSAAALTDVSLTVDKGDFVIIYGKSGCGKSTLLNILGTMDRPTDGSYYFDDTDICGLRFNELSGFRNRHFTLSTSSPRWKMWGCRWVMRESEKVSAEKGRESCSKWLGWKIS